MRQTGSRRSTVAALALLLLTGFAASCASATAPRDNEPTPPSADRSTRGVRAASFDVVDATTGASLAADATVELHRIDANGSTAFYRGPAGGARAPEGRWLAWVEDRSGEHLPALHHVTVGSVDDRVVLQLWRPTNVWINTIERPYVDHGMREPGPSRLIVFADASRTLGSLETDFAEAAGWLSNFLANGGSDAFGTLLEKPADATQLADLVAACGAICAYSVLPVEQGRYAMRFVLPRGASASLCDAPRGTSNLVPPLRSPIRDLQDTRRVRTSPPILDSGRSFEVPVDREARYSMHTPVIVTGRFVERDGLTPVARAPIEFRVARPGWGKFQRAGVGTTDEFGRFEYAVLAGLHELRVVVQADEQRNFGRSVERYRQPADVPLGAQQMDLGDIRPTTLPAEVRFQFDWRAAQDFLDRAKLDNEEVKLWMQVYRVDSHDPPSYQDAEISFVPSREGVQSLGRLEPGNYRVLVFTSSAERGSKQELSPGRDGFTFVHPDDTGDVLDFRLQSDD